MYRTIILLLILKSTLIGLSQVYQNTSFQDPPNYSSDSICQNNIHKLFWGPQITFNMGFQENVWSTDEMTSKELGLGVKAAVFIKYIYNKKFFTKASCEIAYDYIPNWVIDSSAPDSNKYNLHKMGRIAIQLPLHIGYRFNLMNQFGLGLFTGIRFSYGLAGYIDNLKYENYHLYGPNGIWRNFNLSIPIGITFDQLTNLEFTLTGNFGVIKMNRQRIFRDNNCNESDVCFTFSYLIPFK